MESDFYMAGRCANPNGSPQNLKMWKPGQSGNPGGKPKGCVSIMALVHILLR